MNKPVEMPLAPYTYRHARTHARTDACTHSYEYQRRKPQPKADKLSPSVKSLVPGDASELETPDSKSRLWDAVRAERE